jgi:16S rRNA (cytosine967-C5)-methyltransferase
LDIGIDICTINSFTSSLELHKRCYLKTIDNTDFSSFYMNYINIFRSQTRLCAEILKKTEEELANGVPADQLLSKIFRLRKEIGSRDRRLINDLIFSSYRWKGWLKHFDILSQEELFALALLLDGKNGYKIYSYWGENLKDKFSNIDLVNFNDGLEEKLKIFINGSKVNSETVKELFPSWLFEKDLLLKDIVSNEKVFLNFAETIQTRSPLWIRSSIKNNNRFSSTLEKANISFFGHPVIKSALAITTHANLNIIKELKSIPHETQDLSSQVVGLICSPRSTEKWLDACAGSGGKTLHLAHLSRGKGEIVAHDIRMNMLKKIKTRSKKWKLKNITIIENPKTITEKHSKGFDGVLVDAPCSGIGTWRRNPDARWRLGRSEINSYSEIQYEILSKMSLLVRGGGVLVYSVCTLTRLETSDCINRFLKNFKAFKLLPFTNPLNGEQTDGTLDIWPQAYNCDGMFVVKMQKSN